MRRVDWVPRLREALYEQAEAPFEWGVRDCCLAAGMAAAAISTVDPVLPFRPTTKGPRYKTPGGALNAMRRYLRGETPPADMPLLEAVCVKRAADLILPEVPPLHAQRGDLVLAQAETEDGFENVLSIVDLSGQHLATAFYRRGWVRLPLTAGRRAWKI